MREKVRTTTEQEAGGAGAVARALWTTMRPRQWVKNLFVLAPVIFLGPLFDVGRMLNAVVVFGAFCAMASALYILNDIADRERDRMHPAKRLRPIPSGVLSPAKAGVAAVLLGAGAIGAATAVMSSVAILLLAYAALNVAYSYWLKHVVIVDVFCIAFGFVIRVASGSIAAKVPPSAWIIIATFLLALFLALAKRRHEVELLGQGSSEHRPVLGQYTTPLLDELISVVTPATLMTYMLYTLDPSLVDRFGSRHLYLSGIFVVFGIFRYLYLVHRMSVGGSPTELLLTDGPLLLAIVGWLMTLMLLIYT